MWFTTGVKARRTQSFRIDMLMQRPNLKARTKPRHPDGLPSPPVASRHCSCGSNRSFQLLLRLLVRGVDVLQILNFFLSHEGARFFVGFTAKVYGLKSLAATSACTTESCEEDPLQ